MATTPTPAVVSLDEEARSELASLLESQADWEEDARAGSVPDWSEDFADAAGDPTIDDPAATADASFNAGMESFARRQEAASGAVSRYRDLAKQIRETPELALTEANVDVILESLENKYGARVDADDHPGYLRALPDEVPGSIRAVVQQVVDAELATVHRDQAGVGVVRVGGRFWPRGFDSLDDGPASLRVLGDPAVLEGDAVVVNMAHEPIPPLGLANLGQLAREIAPSDVAVAGDLSSHGDRETVLAAVAAGGRGVLFTGSALTFGGEVNPEVQGLVDRGVTVVTLAEAEAAPSSPSAVSEALAAYSTVNLVPSVRMDAASIAQTLHAKEMGRAVAVVPTAMPLDAASRMSPDLDFPDATIVRSGRELVDLVGPPVETRHEQLLAELRERGFTPAVARLDVPQESKNRLFELAEGSADLREFQAKLQYAGSQVLPPAEYLHLTSMLDDQGKDLSLAQAHAQARSFGLDTIQPIPLGQERKVATNLEPQPVGTDREGNPVYDFGDGQLGVYRSPDHAAENIHPDDVTFKTAEWSATGDHVVPEFGWRMENLKEAGRLSPDAEAHLVKQFQASASTGEFRDRVQNAPAGLLDPVERRYLVAALTTSSEDVEPATWEDCVRAQSAADAHVQVQHQQRQEQDRAQLARPVMAMQQ